MHADRVPRCHCSASVPAGPISAVAPWRTRLAAGSSMWAGASEHSRKHGDDLFRKIIAARNRKDVESTISGGVTKRLRASNLQFIAVPAPRIEEQAVRVLDVSVENTPSWRIGMNKTPIDLETKMVGALQAELQANQLYLHKLSDGSVALHTEVARREGDAVFPVTGLLFDGTGPLEAFLNMGGHRVLCDKLLHLCGVILQDDAPGSLYMAVTGAARYLRHYLGIRRGGPNVALRVDTAAGCGDGLVTARVATRNSVGIAARSPIVVNFGNQYDLSVAAADASTDEADAKRFRGVLDTYFEKQLATQRSEGGVAVTLPTPTVEKQGEKEQKEQGPKDEARGAASDSSAPAASQGSAQPQPPPAEAAEPPAAEPSAKKLRASPPADAGETKTTLGQTETVLGTFESPVKGSLVFKSQPKALVLRTSGSGNKKFPPKTVMAKFKNGKVIKEGDDAIMPWTFKSFNGRLGRFCLQVAPLLHVAGLAPSQGQLDRMASLHRRPRSIAGPAPSQGLAPSQGQRVFGSAFLVF